MGWGGGGECLSPRPEEIFKCQYSGKKKNKFLVRSAFCLAGTFVTLTAMYFTYCCMGITMLLVCSPPKYYDLPPPPPPLSEISKDWRGKQIFGQENTAPESPRLHQIDWVHLPSISLRLKASWNRSKCTEANWHISIIR